MPYNRGNEADSSYGFYEVDKRHEANSTYDHKSVHDKHEDAPTTTTSEADADFRFEMRITVHFDRRDHY